MWTREIADPFLKERPIAKFSFRNFRSSPVNKSQGEFEALSCFGFSAYILGNRGRSKTFIG